MSSLEMVVRGITRLLRNLNAHCFVCLQPLGVAFHKMRTCGAEMCEFRFEENELGNLFLEVKRDPEIAHFLVVTTYMAFFSDRAPDLTEPFPSFLLLKPEMRPKTGNLEYIQEAQAAKQDVK